ncbi:cupin domain-containing protein [Candidatus Borrarchaeum sp.]|uniref:cupin domain-containing protein n=1 Tax=Candidatus Borrarchaeum sp. TaxID=2846742 RepID=UPI00257C005F|nr:cupin domain-containing protein [Candidatus Borrarchaeum sp.]
MGTDEIVLLKVDEIKGSKKEEGVFVKLLASGKNVSLSLLQAEPGTSFEIHDHEEEELSYILQGKAILTVEEEIYDIEAPYVIKIPPHVRHGLTVIGTETLLKLNAHSPPRITALRHEPLK